MMKTRKFSAVPRYQKKLCTDEFTSAQSFSLFIPDDPIDLILSLPPSARPPTAPHGFR